MEQSERNIHAVFTFRYMGMNKTGEKVVGLIDSRSLVLAKVELRKQGIIIHNIARKRNTIFTIKNTKITTGDIALFSRQLATMIESGIPLVQSFDIISKGQSNQHFKELINNIRKDVESGFTLAEALLKHPAYFNELICNLVDAGEKSGTLDIMLNKIAAYKEKTETIKKKIKKALTYPIAVLVVALIITVGLLIFVVPQFEALFKGFGAELPAMTQAIIYLSRFFQLYWYLFFCVIGCAVFCCIYLKKYSSDFRQFIDRMLLKAPVIGTIIEKAAIARFARTLSITFAAGLPLVNALKSVAGATGNIIFTQATELIKNEVSTGQQISKAMKNTLLFPNMVVQMVAVGEESGTLEKMLRKIADFYEEDVDNSVDSLSNLLEPIIMSILGILVGGLVIAMYLPIFKLGSAI